MKKGHKAKPSIAILSPKEGQAMGEPRRIEVTEETGFGAVEVVGLRFYRDAMVEIAGHLREYQGLDVEAVLVLDDKNPHDPLAVRVDVQGKTIGHLSREDAREYREWLQEVGHPGVWATWNAMISGGRDVSQHEVSVSIGPEEAEGEGEDNL